MRLKRKGDWKVVTAIVLYAAVMAVIACIATNQYSLTGDRLPETGISLCEMRTGALQMEGEARTEFAEWVGCLCEQYKIDTGIILAIIQKESGWNENATNPDSGAAGLMQIIPATWSEQVLDICTHFGLTVAELPFDPLDEYDNVRIGTRLLSKLLKKYDFMQEKALPYALDCYALGEAGAEVRLLRLDEYVPTAWATEVMALAASIMPIRDKSVGFMKMEETLK